MCLVATILDSTGLEYDTYQRGLSNSCMFPWGPEPCSDRSYYLKKIFLTFYMHLSTLRHNPSFMFTTHLCTFLTFHI